MCGICGVLDLRGEGRIDRNILTAMTDSLLHRGPDEAGYFIGRNVGLGFRRLSIVDLAGGNQPLYNEDRSVVLICNGEIYNFQDLRYELEDKGHRFYTRSDVEVLVHLYEEHGSEFVKRLSGQFAFCLHDFARQKTILARDHTGIAPLFFCESDGLFLFASEIKALLRHPAVNREVDLSSLDQIITFPGFVSPRTMFKEIHSLPPGHSLVIENNRVTEREYWDLVYPLKKDIPPERSEEYYLDRLDELLTQSVRRRLQADVPVGFYLSGGLDSSLIASYLHRLNPNDSFHSFSIGFNESRIDEQPFQRLMVERVNSIHNTIMFDWEEIANRLRRVILHAEGPVKESYDACTMALAELVHRHNLKVVLTGEGSDELFAGYVGYRLDAGFAGETGDYSVVEEELERELRLRLWGDADVFYERNYHEFRELKASLYSPRLRDHLADFEITANPFLDASKIRGRHSIHQRSYIDFKLRIADHLLADHGDRMSFASSVEGRFPFLDVDLIEFVAQIPPDLQIRNNTEKYLLKKLGSRFLPRQIAEREKFAFVAPGSPFLLRQKTEWLEDLLSRETIKRQGYFDPDTIERLKKQYSQDQFSLNQTFETDFLMIVITFGLFLELFEMPSY